MTLHDELIEITRRAFPVPKVSYVDKAIAVIANYDPDPTAMQLYHLTAPLEAASACYVGIVGLGLRKERLADLARWSDDGGP